MACRHCLPTLHASQLNREMHQDSLATLREQSAALRTVAPAARGELAHALYLALSSLIAENLEHMLVEETKNNEHLWALYSNDEVIAIHGRLLSAAEPSVMMEAIGWMARGLSVPELAQLPPDACHAPWKAGAAPAPYHAPIMDLGESRRRALEAYARIKGA